MTVRLEGVTVRYGNHVAVRDVTVEFPSGAVGLLGRNGAGKSSILKSLLGLVRPATGRMQILDLPAGASPTEIRRHVGYMPERDGHISGLSGFEMVCLLAELSGLSRRNAYRRAHEALYLVGLDEQRYRRVSGYSTGMRQKVKLAAALVHDPAVLFLDEPTNGLDPEGRAEMLRLIRVLARDLGKSIVLSTHILPDVEEVCTAAVLLDNGTVVAQGALSDLTRTVTRSLFVQFEPIELRLPVVPGAELHEVEPGRWRADVGETFGADALFRAVVAAGGQVRQLVEHRRSLEEVFVAVVKGQVAAAAPGAGGA